MTPTTLADWLAYQEQLHPRTIDLGLDRLRRVLARLQWQPPTCPVITVGGTNGKGSCVALLESILSAGGYRVGTFTSPHLLRYNERIRVASQEISEASLVAAFERIEAARGDVSLTFFEFNTLAALLIFATAGVDAMVLEVGLGGRLDAVNAVDPDVAIVCSVSLDHCDWLGNDVEAIGREKAGIFRARRPALFGAMQMPNSIAAEARRLGATLYRLGEHFRHDAIEDGWRFTFAGQTSSLLPMPALAGKVQLDNAATALTALRLLSSRLPVKSTVIDVGLRNVRLPGRFQPIAAPFGEWILDVAHNPAAAATLAQNLRARPCSGRTIAVCGMFADKDVQGVVQALHPIIDSWVVAGVAGARALAPQKLADVLKAVGVTEAAQADDVAGACRQAQALANPGDRIVVFGSFHTVGPALQYLAHG